MTSRPSSVLLDLSNFNRRVPGVLLTVSGRTMTASATFVVHRPFRLVVTTRSKFIGAVRSTLTL